MHQIITVGFELRKIRRIRRRQGCIFYCVNNTLRKSADRPQTWAARRMDAGFLLRKRPQKHPQEEIKMKTDAESGGRESAPATHIRPPKGAYAS